MIRRPREASRQKGPLGNQESQSDAWWGPNRAHQKYCDAARVWARCSGWRIVVVEPESLVFALSRLGGLTGDLRLRVLTRVGSLAPAATEVTFEPSQRTALFFDYEDPGRAARRFAAGVRAIIEGANRRTRRLPMCCRDRARCRCAREHGARARQTFGPESNPSLGGPEYRRGCVCLQESELGMHALGAAHLVGHVLPVDSPKECWSACDFYVSSRCYPLDSSLLCGIALAVVIALMSKGG